MKQIVLTLLVLNICHWAADFTHLSTPWMLAAKRYGKPLFPILVHALVHTLLFFGAIFFLMDMQKALIAAAIQLPTHFAIDTFKGKLNVWFPSLENMQNPYHWYIFGADQFLHQTVIISIVSFLHT
ncbi:MAG: DUF3307 domain-containing protein [Thermonemataceae bacterium]|nr:DUF3307 domain-containing protein [Thermonemataceae bacterium]